MMKEFSSGFGEHPDFVKHPQALERANRIIREGRIEEESFADLYGSDVIKTDRKKVDKRKEQFSADDFRNSEHRILKEKSFIFESILYQEGDGAMWFGENSTIIMPSEFDDIFNGIDNLVEIERQGGLSIAALSIDLTFKKDVAEKLYRVVDKLKKGYLSKVKYYQSELGDLRGEVKNIPHFVVGVDGGTLAELTNLFADSKSSQFAEHQVQFQVIESIIIQAEAFARLGEFYGADHIVKAYERMARIFKEIYKERSKVVKDKGQRDLFFEHLKQDLAVLLDRESKK